eukprot:363768-Chlamydomonas_euryale.AAC.7
MPGCRCRRSCTQRRECGSGSPRDRQLAGHHAQAHSGRLEHYGMGQALGACCRRVFSTGAAALRPPHGWVGRRGSYGICAMRTLQ